MSPDSLTPSKRKEVLEAVEQAVAQTCPTYQSEWWTDLSMADERLEHLIKVAQQLGSNALEVDQAEITDAVCAYCPQQTRSGHCPLRDRECCIIAECAAPIVSAIAYTLGLCEAPFSPAGDPAQAPVEQRLGASL